LASFASCSRELHLTEQTTQTVRANIHIRASVNTRAKTTTRTFARIVRASAKRPSYVVLDKIVPFWG